MGFPMLFSMLIAGGLFRWASQMVFSDILKGGTKHEPWKSPFYV